MIWLDKQAFGYDDAAILTDMISILEEKEIISQNKWMEEQYEALGISREVYEFGEKIEDSLKNVLQRSMLRQNTTS